MNINALDQDIIVITYEDDTVFVTTESNLLGQSAIEFQDEGLPLGTVGTVTEVDFTGAGVSGSRLGSKVTYNIPGGGGGGSGDVVGPASAVDDRIATFDGVTGKLIKDGGYTITNIPDLVPDIFSFFRPGAEHLPNMLINAVDSNFVLSTNQLRAVPFVITKTIIVTAMSFNVTANVALSKARAGIYTANATTYLPDQLVSGSDAVEYDTASNGVKTSGAVSITLTPGLYWFAILANGAITVRAFATSTGSVTSVLGGSSLTTTGVRAFSSWIVNLTYTTMPATFTAGGAGADSSIIKFSITV